MRPADRFRKVVDLLSSIGVSANQISDGLLELFGGRNGICESIGSHYGPVVVVVVVVVVVLVDPVSGLRGDSS